MSGWYGGPENLQHFRSSGLRRFKRLKSYRRRVNGDRGMRLLRSRGEKSERTFAHCCETGGMRLLYLRGRENVAERVPAHAAAFDAGLLMRVRYGLRKPRSLTARAAAAAGRTLLLDRAAVRPVVSRCAA